MFPRRPELPATGVVISQNRPCSRCSYNLVGLKTGDRCPECGTPIVGDILRGVPSMGDAPLPYLESLAKHAKLCAAGMGLNIAGVLWLVGFGGVPEFPPGAALLLAIGSVLWLWGTRGVIVPRSLPPGSKVDTEAEWRGFRHYTRAMQWAWPLAGVVVFVIVGTSAAMAKSGATSSVTLGASAMVATASNTGEAVVIGLMATLLITATIMVMLYLSLLAGWAQDTALSNAFTMAPLMLVISIPAGLLVHELVPTLLGKWLVVFSAPFLLVVGTGFVYLASFWILPLVRFAALTSWAVANVNESQAKDRRTTARIVARIEAGKAKAEGKKPAKKAEKQAKTAGEAGAAAPVDPNLYELAPDEPWSDLRWRGEKP
ncbi:MAG: hypothetical protein WC718_15135 [Phycisphaerales bacterium]|jgi:hypothetical protein